MAAYFDPYHNQESHLKAIAAAAVRRLLWKFAAKITIPVILLFLLVLFVLGIMSGANYMAFPENGGDVPILADAYPQPEKDKALLQKYEALTEKYQLADAYDLGQAVHNPAITHPDLSGDGTDRTEFLMAFGSLPERPYSSYIRYNPAKGPEVKVNATGRKKEKLDDYRGDEETPYEIREHLALEWGQVHYPCLMYAYQAGMSELPDDSFKEKTARDMHSYLFYYHVTLHHYAYYPPGPDGTGGGSESWSEDKSVLVEANGPAHHYVYTYMVVREYWSSPSGAHGYDDGIVPISQVEVRKAKDKWLRDWLVANYNIPRDPGLGITAEAVWQGSIAFSTRKENIGWLNVAYQDDEEIGRFASDSGVNPNIYTYIEEASALTGIPTRVLLSMALYYSPTLASEAPENGGIFHVSRANWEKVLPYLVDIQALNPVGNNSPSTLYQAYIGDPRAQILVGAYVLAEALKDINWQDNWKQPLSEALGESARAVLNIYEGLAENTPIWPVAQHGTITSYYGAGRYTGPHHGLDIAVPRGTPVYAVLSGIVSEVGSADTWNGNYVKITTLGGMVHSYCHLETIYVQEGQQIVTSPAHPFIIGTVGNTGHIYSQGREIWNADGHYTGGGYHLHFQVSIPGQGTIDPLTVLPR